MNDFSFFFSRPGQNAALFRVILDGQFCGPHICALPHFFCVFFFDEHSGKLMTIFDVAVFVWLFELCLHVDVAANLSKKILSDLAGIEQVLTVRLLGVIFQSSLSFVAHVDYILKVCSQRIFLLKQLRAQGMPLEQLHTIFQAIILQRLAYALPAWGPFLSVDVKHKIGGFFFKRSFISLWFH